MDTHPVTLKPVPRLASKYKISPDNKSFTFYIDKDARWSDGKPVTARDVRFTHDTIMNPKNMTSLFRVSLKNFHPPEVIDDKTIVFKVKNKHWINFIEAYAFIVLPKHLYEGKDFNKSFNMVLPGGSGPYRLAEVKKGRYIILERRKDYWGDKLPINFGRYNFDKVKFKSVMQQITSLNYVKKGDTDMMAVNTAKYWVKEFNISAVKNNWLKKKRIYNYEPRGFQGICINLRREKFKDLRVRKAIAHLINQKELIEKMMYNLYSMQKSYWPHITGNNKNNPYYYYEPKKARKLLKEAGWDKVDSEGYLVKDNKRLEVTILYASKYLEKYFTIFMEDFKKVGIKGNLELVSFSTFTKRMDEYKFDLVWLNWSASLFPNPEAAWSSKEIDKKAGNNVPGLSNMKVDRLLKKYALTYDINQRNNIIKQMDTIIYAEMPYIIIWNADCTKIVYWDKFGHPEKFLTKIGDEYDIIDFWWSSPEKAERLRESIKNKVALPLEPLDVYYDAKLKKLKQ